MHRGIALRAGAWVMGMVGSAGVLAQSAALENASDSRRERLLNSMRTDLDSRLLVGKSAEFPSPWSTTCGAALKLSVLEGGLRVLSTPLYCEANRDALTLSVDTDGYVAEGGSSKLRGLADVNLGGNWLTAVGASKLALSAGANWPSQTDVGSEHTDVYAGLTWMFPAQRKLEPRLEYTVQRNSDPAASGGRSTQVLGAAADYLWSETTTTGLSWTRTKPRDDAGSNAFKLSHAFAIVPGIGLSGRLFAVRSQRDWNAGASMRFGTTF